MPVRFVTPSLGVIDSSRLQAHRWQVDVSYRRLHADTWYVGTAVQESAAPFGKPLFLNLDSLDLSVQYGVSNRLSLMLTAPFSRGTHSRFYADGKRHKVSATGLGDITLIATRWFRNPAEHPASNVALGVGMKAPTGSDGVTDNFFLANGVVVQRPVDQSIQLGDGGWGIVLQAQGYRSVFRRASAYATGWYVVSPREQTHVASPIPGVRLSVPDVYSARFGWGYAFRNKPQIAGTVGLRFDGIPVHDLVGGSAGFRRPGYSLYLEPGLSVDRGPTSIRLSVPLRVHQNFRPSLADRANGKVGGGDLADSLVLLGYSFRF